ncbi:hypothetical protein CQA38_08105 [Campylobacter sp. MIT 12-5580]|nr:hypothetical protein CQA38_08105 [Campylobacter sp. MIT 12-5580]
MQDYNACINKDEQACKRLISLAEPKCNDKSLSKEARGLACSVVAVGYSNNKEYHEAASFHQKACDLGDKSGCAKLGYFYHNGLGVRQSFQKAASFSQKGCDLNDAVGCAMLGGLYEIGKGVKQNKAKAKEYYGKSCDLGHQPGCDNYKRLNSK